jgi:hypothetical protein
MTSLASSMARAVSAGGSQPCMGAGAIVRRATSPPAARAASASICATSGMSLLPITSTCSPG